MRREQTHHSKAWYNALSPYYDVLVDPFQGRLRRRGIEWFGVSPDDRVLDIGCGTGRGIATLQNAVASDGHVIGIDVAEQMCQLAQDRLDDEDPSAVVCGDALSLPFDADSFDAVLVSFALELFDDDHRTAVLAEIHRVLRPSGRICVISPTTAASDIVSLLYTRLNDAFPTLVDSRPLDVSAVLTTAGFGVVQTRIEWAVIVPVEVVVAHHESRA
ncbi:class I SAM-dependent methyltransferase [Natronolimnobius baerhuensis]|uniref:2-heptaprenyl-1,4-naphthoquinone methyltransferase n=1 Tax=Natronolimnobius baerhuensis TaxID=253108 RepID=A0A202EBU3_9EURY|nr:methyltransferase domain-containing protein [Natronolimnobius baerhuensis]OVE85753.1 2-heptaprenyl-1,4-naphthoquinone methyltransferase [Natronolimnobius baerhuensis]